tara:strand:- start:1121 stop:1390 length:270 start_codon:yes stop_codon:yes gene_type:complete
MQGKTPRAFQTAHVEAECSLLVQWRPPLICDAAGHDIRTLIDLCEDRRIAAMASLLQCRDLPRDLLIFIAALPPGQFSVTINSLRHLRF